MPDASLATALEDEHHRIDAGIERFAAAPSSAQGRASLSEAIEALRRHIYLEEEFLFPALQQAGEPGLAAPVFVMLREHAQLWASLDDLERELATGLDDAAAQHRCHLLLVALQHHNVKEERILYPEADRTLTPEVAERLNAFLADGKLPEGWVCAKARS